MHAEAMQWVLKFATDANIAVLDIGGRDINGTPRPFFPNAVYTVLDILPGENVDIVADAATWKPTRLWDMVLCTEVFEHTPTWPQIIMTAYCALVPGGMFVATMAAPGRLEHSGIDGMILHPGEYYGNVSPHALQMALTNCGFFDIVIDEELSTSDVRCVARKGGGK